MASPTQSTPPTIIVSNTIRSSGYEVEPPIRAQPTQMGMSPVTFPFLTSGGLRGSHHLPPPFITYGRCNKNHASSTSTVIVLDGCGEFMPLHNVTDPNDPSFFICDACRCHRSFHREHLIMPTVQPVHNFVDYPCPSGGSHDAPSPPIPVSSSG
ncbi:zinc-finger homeodomain-containing protein 11 [Artemisia annua]|uniref:Zinc-finger homeodomain-containing protein 11 n=1 Tax=Artemisia annua TaxID=35608 RepID=A0A2U1LJF9_ARTAN|nr:zinc-finger homeodomain-containing protein 11 [Artemisia annua]